MKSKKVNIICSSLFISLVFYCSSTKESSSSQGTNEKPKVEASSSNTQKFEANNNYNEQISCHPTNCVQVEYDQYEELDEQISKLMGENTGKFLIKMQNYTLNMESKELEDVLQYLRELSKRDGKVSIEPYYMGTREMSIPVPVIKDVALTGWDVYKRIKNRIKYRNTKQYNAKVLIHPKHSTVMMVFFVHKNYGDMCNTIYSNCEELEYIDDETFDQNLSKTLKEAAQNNKVVRVNFSQKSAVLPEAKIDLGLLGQMNDSVRIYKWLIATKETKKKSVSQERFLTFQLALSIVDYSLKAYDLVKSILMYSPAFKTTAEVTYIGNEKGGKIQSVVFSPYKEKE
ncbi:MAG: hypothetical protein H7A23_22115 [Leptospiraceae bacterium]|nr:hypothetical protein [Leptospiraceae bacterium]MCP5497257.1 hypothetical protein [Leptospiraceae bacterium]